uniref:DDHD domain-containing protein n=1 Tax=Heterorhabditis bacteriophora TaxID=37862 RepID=A0A1I7WQY6_HETBA
MSIGSFLPPSGTCAAFTAKSTFAGERSTREMRKQEDNDCGAELLHLVRSLPVPLVDGSVPDIFLYSPFIHSVWESYNELDTDTNQH